MVQAEANSTDEGSLQAMDQHGQMKSLSDCRVIALLNSSEVYGQEKANLQVLRALRESGAQVLAGITDANNGGEVRQWLERLQIDSFMLSYGCQWSKQFFRAVPSLVLDNIKKVGQCSRKLRGVASDWKASHLHIGNALTYSFVAPYLALNRRIKLVYRMGDEPPHDSAPNLLIWKQCYRRADQVVANSQFVRNSILRAIPKDDSKLRVIHNCAFTEKQASSLHGPKPEPRVSQESFRILFVGQVAPHKGVHDLIEAMIRLEHSPFDLHLDILGGSSHAGDYLANLTSRVQDTGNQHRIRFHGYQANPLPFYSQADLLVVPSRFEEPSANVVLEAKELGIPSIVFPSGGLPELVTHGENGYICREKTSDEIVNGITWFLSNPERLEKAKRSAIQDSRQRFGWNHFSRAWQDVYLDRSRSESDVE